MCYSIAVYGRSGDETTPVADTTLLVDPVVPDFGRDLNSSVVIFTNNITLRALKPLRALQVLE